MSIANVYANSSPAWWTRARWLRWALMTLRDAALRSGKLLAELFDPCPRGWRPGDPSGLDIDWQEDAYINRPGGRGHSGQAWWTKAMSEMASGRCTRQIHCFFNDENRITLNPAPLLCPGWLVTPIKREPFIWGGPDSWNDTKRKHGELQKSPANHTVFWSSVLPATPPVPCIIERTGAAYLLGAAA